MPTRLADRIKLLLLLLLLWSPGLATPWLAKGLDGGEAVGVVLLSLVVIALPLCVVTRWRWYFLGWLPVVPLIPVYLYLCFYYRSVPGDVLVSAALHTDLRDSWVMAASFGWRWLGVLAALIAYLWLALTIDARAPWRWRRQMLAIVLTYAMVGLLGRQDLARHVRLPALLDKQIVELVFPVNLALSAQRVVEKARQQGEHVSVAGRRPLDGDALVILVIGESVRRDHMSLYGYARPTTPWLDRHRDEFIVFADMASSAQWTAAAFPALVTRPVGPAGDERPASLVQTFREAGFTTAWFSNQEPSSLSRSAHVSGHSTDEQDFYFRKDASLLPPFEAFKRQAGPRQFVVLHMMGSHFPYDDRYTVDERVFRPTLTDRGVSGHPPLAEREAAVNSYDNTLIALDRFFERLIGSLRAEARPVLLMFTSDHGENLFDGGRDIFMHARPEPTCHDLEVPLLVWTNAPFRAANAPMLEALRAHRDRRLGHRDIFPTQLQLAGIEWRGQDPRDSFASPRFVEKPRALIGRAGKAARTYDDLCPRGASPAAP